MKKNLSLLAAIFVSALFFFPSESSAVISNGANAVDLLGQYDQTSLTDPVPQYTKSEANDGPNRLGLNGAQATVLDAVNHRLFVSEYFNHRVLVFNLDVDNNFPDRIPDYVLGQPNFYTNSSATTQAGLTNPRGLAYDSAGNRLFVSDEGSHRVIVYDIATISNGENAVNVIGQTLFTTATSAHTQSGIHTPHSVAYDAVNDRLFVSEAGGHRVKVWDVSSITNGENAINVLGQTNFTGSGSADSQSGMKTPRGLAYDVNNDRLFVSEQSGARVKVWNVDPAVLIANNPATDGANAINVLGQTNFTGTASATTQSGLESPIGVAHDAVNERLFVASSSRRRIMVWDVDPTVLIANNPATDGANAINVLGQSLFTTSTLANTQSGLNAPVGAFYDPTGNRLFVAETTPNRVKIFDVDPLVLIPNTPATNGPNAIDLIGQYDQTSLVDPVPLYTRSGVNDGPNIFGFNSPAMSTFDFVNHRYFVSDSANNRVLVYNLNTDNTFPDRVPDNVLGQPNFYTNTAASTQAGMRGPYGLAYDSANNRLFVAESSGHRVKVWDVTSITNGENAINVLGQALFTTGTPATTQAGMSTPGGLAYDAANDKLFVAETGNHRVTIWDVDPAVLVANIPATDGPNALNVLGQTLFTTDTSAATQAGMYEPIGLAYDAANSRLFVADSVNIRVTVWDVASITDGENAVNVLGQTLFMEVFSGEDTQAGMQSPKDLVYDADNDRLFVSDGNRVKVWDVTSITDGEAAFHVLGQALFTTNDAANTQAGLNNPFGLAYDSTNDLLFVAQSDNRRISVFDVEADLDSDGIADDDEDSVNNNGDGNGDGILDSEQANVASVINPVTGESSTLETAGDCTMISSLSAETEGSQDAQDADYEYPVGMFDFALSCDENGATADVTVYLDQVYDTSQWIFRKYNNTTDEYADVSTFTDVTVATTDVGGSPVTTFSYAITDGDEEGDEDGLANSVILDPIGPAIPTGSLISVIKQANKKEVSVGDIVTYAVTIENVTAGALGSVTIQDRYPAGFKYIAGRAVLDGVAIADPTDNHIDLTFDAGSFTAGQSKTLKYQMIIGSGVGFGSYGNSAFALSSGIAASNTASESVKVVPSALFDLGTVIGKVFEDQNGNGRQDKGEKLVGRVKILTEDGLTITADKRGLYHWKGVKPGRHVLRVDESSLPPGTEFTDGRQRIVDVRPGYLLKVSFGVKLPEGAQDGQRVFRVERRQENIPRLNAGLYKDTIFIFNDTLAKPAEFMLSTNYQLFFDTWTLELINKDTEYVYKSWSGNAGTFSDQILWSGEDDFDVIRRIRNSPESVAYRLKVKDAQGHEDVTQVKLVAVKIYEGLKPEPELDEDSYEAWRQAVRHGNSLSKRAIRIKGQMVKVTDIADGVESVVIAHGGTSVAEISLRSRKHLEAEDVLAHGSSAAALEAEADIILPEGNYRIEAGDSSGSVVAGEDIRATEDYMMLVALADAEGGYNHDKGDIEVVRPDDRYDEDYWLDGKLAYQLKGKIKGKYLVESSFDSERQQNEVFRNLDPDKYYPVYGDGSKTDYGASNTQGNLYVKVSWDESEAVWGNFNTGLMDTEFFTFNRSLYGGKVHLETVERTKFNDPKTKVTAFSAASKEKKGAHNEFLGTGGSLYYLNHTNVSEGSEKVVIEIRDKVTGMVIGTHPQRQGVDYTIDYTNGRIIFNRAIPMTAESSAIISSELLDGHPLYVMVDYEYESLDRYLEGVSGGRIAQALGDHVVVGASYVKEEQLKRDFTLEGVDTTVHLSENTKLKAEYAESESESGRNSLSTDGGLTFTELATNENAHGTAYGATLSSHLMNNSLGLGAQYKWVDADFSSSGSISRQGKEYIGFKATYNINQTTSAFLSYDIQNLFDGANAQTTAQTGADQTQTLTAQIQKRIDKWTLTAEGRHQEIEDHSSAVESESNREEDAAAVRADYKVNEKLSVFGEQQVTIKNRSQDDDNHQTTVGLRAQVAEWLAVRIQEVIGTEGMATGVGFSTNATIMDKIKLTGDYDWVTDSAVGSGSANGATSIGAEFEPEDGQKVFADYTVSGLADAASIMRYGVTEELNEHYTLTSDRSYSQSKSENVTADAKSLTGRMNENWAGTLGYLSGEVQNLDGSRDERQAGSAALAYVRNDSDGEVELQGSSKVEIRMDDGATDQRQWLLVNSLEGRVTDNLSLFGKLDWSETENTSANSTDAEFREIVIGGAYRPLDFDWLNIIARYAYQEDMAPSGQIRSNDIEDETMHVFSIEDLIDITDEWELMQKFAYKMGEEKVSGFADYTDSETWLILHRISYEFKKDWTAGVEYRYLTQREAKDYRQGFLLEVARDIGETFQIAFGYNFTDFNDDLTNLDYRSSGPYFRVTGAFNESIFNRLKRKTGSQEQSGRE